VRKWQNIIRQRLTSFDNGIIINPMFILAQELT